MYEFFQIVDGSHDDPTLFPVLSGPEQPLPFETEPADGQRRDLFESRAITILQRTPGGWTRQRSFTDLRFSVVITDARVVVYCEKWTKGGGWLGFGVGGLAFAAAANVVSHARAARRRKGKLLVAQVRHPWLREAGTVSDKHGRPAALRLVVDAGTHAEPRLLAMDIGLARSDSAALAAGIVTLAARFRLASGPPVPEQELATWRRMAQDAASHGGNGVWTLPSAVPVGAATSVPAGGAVPAPSGAVPVPIDGRAADLRPAPLPAPVPGPLEACRACGHVATVAVTTCPRCGLAVAELGGSTTAGTLVGTPASIREPGR